ncbi:Hint domain-containing protein [Celeribacter sp.]|uniref:Hint domain-containing protein n=1 Tax=Celeribacter sp. TaxID=1890673 RepID=UPI003A8DDE53
MPVTVDFTDDLYSYSGDLVSLLSVSVLPSFSSVSGTSISITDSDGTLTPGEASTINIDGSAEAVTYVGVASFNDGDSGLVGGLLGALLGSTEAAVFQTGSGNLYLYAPDGFPVISGVAVGVSVDQTASFNLSSTEPGVVDGLNIGETMDVGYEDVDGDEITDYAFLVRSGNDTIYGNGGDDTISAGSGHDIVSGGDDNDTIYGESGDDILSGDDGNDWISGGDGEDQIAGGEGADTIFGGDDDDTIYGNTGNDTIYGDGGEDTINGGDGDDIIYGGSIFGTDTEADRLVGGAGNDTIYGGDGTNTIYGEGGDDTITSGVHSDYIVGGEGNDTISAGGGDDTIHGGDGDDIITGGEGHDYVTGGDGNDTWLADGENSTSSAASDEVYLQEGDDYAEVGFFTTGTPDILDGGDGIDTVALDHALVDGLDTDITLHDNGTSTTAGFGTIVNNFENVRGSSGENEIIGNSVDNIFWGLAGDDLLDGGAGDDTIDGGAGSDNMFGGDGNDTFIIGSAADADGDSISGGAGPDDTTDIDEIDLSAIDKSTYTINAVEDSNDAGALTGTVTFDTGEVLSFSGIEIICFAQGTEIITAKGPVNVEDLEVGDMVLTMDNGMQPLRWMGSNKLDREELAMRPNLKPVRIAAGALGNGTPSNDLMVSRQHRILVRSVIAERMFGVSEILVAANKLVGLPGIEVVKDTESVAYYHMLFDQHEIVFSNGAATESLFTGPEALKAVSEDARAEILALFPDIETQTALLPARHIPEKGNSVKRFVERHAKNNKALLNGQASCHVHM